MNNLIFVRPGLQPVRPVIVTPPILNVNPVSQTYLVDEDVKIEIPLITDNRLLLQPNFDTSNNYMAQKQITEFLYYYFLDKELYKNTMLKVLKFFIAESDSKFRLVKSQAEYDKNDIRSLTDPQMDKLSDFISENYFSQSEMKNLLRDIIDKYSMKWYQLTKNVKLVMHEVKHFLKEKLRTKVSY